MNKIRFFLREGALPLLDGESLDAFREALATALREVYGARGLVGFDERGERVGWLWLVEAYDAAVVVEINPMEIEGQPYVAPFYERVPFTRAPNGDFTFGAPVRVRRKIEWEPIEDAEDSVDMEEAIEVHDRERELGVEITTEVIGGVSFPVGDPDGVEHAMWELGEKRPPVVGNSRISRPEMAKLQSVVDHTNRRAGSKLRVRF